MTSLVTPSSKDVSKALPQLDPSAPEDNPNAPSVQTLPVTLSSSSAPKTPALYPNAIRLVILHHHLAQLPGYDPEGYNTLFPVAQILDPDSNDFWPGWKQTIVSHLHCTICILGADLGLNPAAIDLIVHCIPDDLNGVIL